MRLGMARRMAPGEDRGKPLCAGAGSGWPSRSCVGWWRGRWPPERDSDGPSAPERCMLIGRHASR